MRIWPSFFPRDADAGHFERRCRMSQSLPLRANLEWLKKICKERLTQLRSADPSAQLSDAQLQVAREYGFPSWRKLKAHVEQVRDALEAVLPPQMSAGGD